MKPAIEIRNLGKQYKLKNAEPYIALRDVITHSIKNIFSTKKKTTEKFWALQDINLDIMPGERVGIIGRNGAGKSTLLKIISRITPPTTGEAIIRGRVGSLLEVGTGFHPELTGRENIYLNGSILGLKRAEINRQLDEIIDFSGVEKFIDTPLKRYSSGMQMRLAFAVAAHLHSEILLIDEVLAVGDIEFQKKCIGKMEEVSKSEGRTILFVSHDLSAIGTLTQKTVLLKAGRLTAFDQTSKVISTYTMALQKEKIFIAFPSPSTPSLTKVELHCSEGELHAFGKPFSISFEVHMPEADQRNMAISFQIIQIPSMQPVLHYHLFDIEQPSFRKKGINRLQFTAPDFRLYKGDYFLRVYLAESKTKVEFQRTDCCFFRVEMLGIPEIEWGWANDMCIWLGEGKWQTD